jgi:hypothetical protein
VHFVGASVLDTGQSPPASETVTLGGGGDLVPKRSDADTGHGRNCARLQLGTWLAVRESPAIRYALRG